MKRILIINGHPNPNSYCNALCQSYLEGALLAGHEVVMLNLFDLQFNLNFKGSYSDVHQNNLEPDLVFAQEKIKWAQHLVIIHPVWWGSVPALLKGFLDRTLLPGFAFKYRKDSMLWDQLLIGKTAHLIYTSDTPIWFYKLVYRAPSVNMMKDRVLAYCGIKTTKVIGIGPIRKSSENKREKSLSKLKQLAQAI